ncbi:MAG TPA: ABC transporter substrate-binding protein [Burkholderiaceae bacterium]|nr:ABC transporter substrate-binding protein [Burkholderiaceae bacterium]
MRRRLLSLSLLLATWLCACSPLQGVPPKGRVELAPRGTLHAAINLGNPMLARKEGGELRGVSVDLARELAQRLNVPLQFVVYESAGSVVFAAPTQAWDIAFVAIDPVRGREMLQTNPYLIIEGAYLVAADSPIRSNDEVDRAGVRIAVGKGSAYDLYLSRNLKQAQIVYAPTSPAVADLFVAQKLEAAAGVRQQLEADAKRLPGLRVLDGRFMVIQQAMATPAGRESGAAYLNDFVEQMKSSGFITQSMTRNGIQGAVVAPPGPAR